MPWKETNFSNYEELPELVSFYCVWNYHFPKWVLGDCILGVFSLISVSAPPLWALVKGWDLKGVDHAGEISSPLLWTISGTQWRLLDSVSRDQINVCFFHINSPISQFSSDTSYLELVQTPQDCPHFRHQMPMEFPGHPHVGPADYQCTPPSQRVLWPTGSLTLIVHEFV